jgi:hypothetical protein
MTGALEDRAMKQGNVRSHLVSTETARAFYRSAGYGDDGPPAGKFGTSSGYPMSRTLVPQSSSAIGLPHQRMAETIPAIWRVADVAIPYSPQNESWTATLLRWKALAAGSVTRIGALAVGTYIARTLYALSECRRHPGVGDRAGRLHHRATSASASPAAAAG